ncbi:MAG: DUF4190 domain-containing protein [Pyrinomonadaceae bacterium]|nr:DUF4190 domain-containing protein [Pyrinomonadaceae bacterium]
MKRCPACDKTFADGMRFCQTDGTVLVEDVPAADPYKTVVGSQSDIASAMPPLDPFKTIVATPPKVEADILQLPEESDLLKTMVVSHDELRAELKAEADAPLLDIPPPFAPSAPLIEPKPASPKEFSPTPKSYESALTPSDSESSSPKSFEIDSSDATADINPVAPPENVASPFDSKPSATNFSTQSPYGNQENKPIPSPFDGSMIGYLPPSAPPFGAPPPLVKEAEPMFGSYQEPADTSSPFQPPSPFGNAEPFNQPIQQTEWTPPPAPMSEWQNQGLGANTPFQPPGAAGGQDQTLAIVSLVCGILGILCCGLVTGIPAIITGYMAKNNVDSNPGQYGGRGLAVAGMIMGGISILFSILGIIYYIVVLASAKF